MGGGRPAEVREFAASTAPRFAADPACAPVLRRERIRLSALPAHLELEVQYALQRRHDEREGKGPPFIVMIMVRFLAGSGASSLLDRTEQEWREAFGRKRSNAVALLAWSRRQVADLADRQGPRPVVQPLEGSTERLRHHLRWPPQRGTQELPCP